MLSRRRLALSFLPVALVARSLSGPSPVVANDNRTPAGVLANGVLTLRLEITRGVWHPDADDEPGIDVPAFAEQGKAPSIPGPLVRVPAGTEVRTTLHNALDSSIVVFGLTGEHADGDTVRLAAGETRELVLHATSAGSFLYNASYSARSEPEGEDRMLTGALVVDEPGARANDRVFVLLQLLDTLRLKETPGTVGELLTINGKAWPNTERLHYAMGDTIRWRVINGSYGVHPMHLHGQYFDVLRRGTTSADTLYAPDAVRTGVTERMLPLSTMSLRWVPVHAGNWLFHCHLNFHVQPHPALGPTVTLAGAPTHEHEEAGGHLMGGLVLGVTVDGPVAADPRPRRQLRLYVQQYDSLAGDYVPPFSYEREDVKRMTIPGEPFIVWQDEPITITVVNRAKGATAVHWHGLEIESYYDGVARFSGAGARTTPDIAPGDSFRVRMTPPRAGTFIYHSHFDDIRQQGGGLYGAFIVVPRNGRWDAAHERQVVVATTRTDGVDISVNDTTARLGETYRLRMINITLDRPGVSLLLRRDSVVQRWDVIAKDGADLRPSLRGVRASRQPISIGETYDAFFTPTAPGTYTFEVVGGSGTLLATRRLVVR